MFSRMSITRSTGNYSENIKRLKDALGTAEAVVIGAGAGLSTAAGFSYSGGIFLFGREIQKIFFGFY